MTARRARTGPDARTASGERKRPPRVPFTVLVLGLIAGTMALLLALNTASAANEVARHDAALQDEQLNGQIVALQNQIAASSAPENIARVAQGFGMVPAGNPAFLRIGVDGAVKVLGNPAAASAPYTPPPAAPRPSTSPAAKPSTNAAASLKNATASATASSTKASSTKASSPAASATAAAPTTTQTAPAPTPSMTPTEALPGGPR
jgi:hypothetical protein